MSKWHCQDVNRTRYSSHCCYGNRSIVSLLLKQGIHCMPCSSQIISKMLPEIHTMGKCDFLKPINFLFIIFLDGWMDGSIDGSMVRWMDGRIDRSMDGSINGWIDRSMDYVFFAYYIIFFFFLHLTQSLDF